MKSLPAMVIGAPVWLCLAHASAQDVVHGEQGRALDALIQRETLGQFWGAVLVAPKGEVALAKGYGLANESLVPITADSLFDIGSISKSFTATAILRLEMEGKLRLDATIDQYLSDVPEHARKVTVRQLLTHTSGVQGTDSPADDTLSSIVESMLRRPPVFTPGSRMEYSNAGYFLLAAIIERVSGTSYEGFMMQRVFGPAGMKASTMVGTTADRPELVTARRDAQNPQRGTALTQPYAFAWGYKGAGGVVSSVRDLLAFDKALRGDALLDASAQRAMFTGGKGGYGMGWYVKRTPRGWRHEHSGGVWGFSSEMIRHEDGTVIIVLTNGHSNPVALAGKLESAAIPEMSESVEAMIEPAAIASVVGGMAKLGSTGAARVDQAGTRVRLTMHDRATPAKAMATIEISQGFAGRLAEDLRSAIDDTPGPSGQGGQLAMLWIATSPYTADERGVMRIGKGAKLIVQQGFQSGDPDGKNPVNDPRPTLILMDDERSFWPIIFVMDPDVAATLAQELDAAAE